MAGQGQMRKRAIRFREMIRYDGEVTPEVAAMIAQLAINNPVSIEYSNVAQLPDLTAQNSQLANIVAEQTRQIRALEALNAIVDQRRK